jgi:ribosomal protein S18 acetylase RimI-like enzyme
MRREPPARTACRCRHLFLSPEFAVIRPTTPADTDALLDLSEATGIFRPSELDELRGMLDAYHAGGLGADHVWVTNDDGGPVGVAYYAPAAMTDQTWNLYLIAVHPSRQGQGRGTALLRHVEEVLTASGGRVLIVETSGLGSFEQTRAFYRKNGYDEEARIRDYYKAGDDKIVFRKALGS